LGTGHRVVSTRDEMSPTGTYFIGIFIDLRLNELKK
jgi:hypothetical protein